MGALCGKCPADSYAHEQPLWAPYVGSARLTLAAQHRCGEAHGGSMYSQAMVSPALMHNLGLPSGLPWLKASHARVIGSLKRAESSPALGCSSGKHGAVSCLQGMVERILTQTAPDSLCSQEVKGIKRALYFAAARARRRRAIVRACSCRSLSLA